MTKPARAAVWRLLVDSNAAPSGPVVALDVWDATALESLGTLTFTRKSWKYSNTFEAFEHPVALSVGRQGHPLAFRTWYSGSAYVVVDWVGYK